VANQTGRPIAPARKLVAAVLGVIAFFVMVYGLGLSSLAVVALGGAMLALAVTLGLVTVARRSARAWVTGHAQVKAVSAPPSSAAAYGRAELQLVVVAPGLPTTEVLVRDPRVPVVKWPTPGDQVPISVDVDDMRRVRIDWDKASDRGDDGDPPPPPFQPTDDFVDDDLLGDVEPPPWASRDRDWGRGPDEPPPPPPAGLDPDEPHDSTVVVRETPAGPVLEGHFVDHDEAPPPLPHRARTAGPDPAPGPSRPPGSRPSPRPHRATATADPDEGTHAASRNAAAAGPDRDADEPDPAPDLATGPDERADQAAAAAEPGRRADVDEPAAAAPADEEIDLPLEGDPEAPPEFTDPAARQAVDDGIMAPPPPADDAPADARPTFVMEPGTAAASPVPPPPPAPRTGADDEIGRRPTISGLDTPGEPTTGASAAAPDPSAGPSSSPAASASSNPAAEGPAAATESDAGAHATVPEQRSGIAKAAAAGAAAVAAAAAAGLAATRKSRDDDPAEPPAEPSATPRDTSENGTAPRQRGPWADLESRGYEPDERADDLITAYPSARPGPAGAIHGVGITVLVTDLARSVALYRETLGFFEIDRGPGSAVLASGDTRLVLRTVHTLAPEAGRLVHLNLEVGDLAGVHQELQAKGVRFEHGPQAVNRGGKLELWAATFLDPDGHTVAVTQWRAMR
jgi:catechol 2,3-dioxygenase-like lactoylglutathione lyase family enzyme